MNIEETYNKTKEQIVAFYNENKPEIIIGTLVIFGSLSLVCLHQHKQIKSDKILISKLTKQNKILRFQNSNLLDKYNLLDSKTKALNKDKGYLASNLLRCGQSIGGHVMADRRYHPNY